jgi:DNA-directed RNA polymerase I, II, and III subunit RPABC2
MSDIDITEELDQDLDQDLYLDEDDLDNLESNKSIKFYPNKNKSDLDNDDNENDYLNDEEPDENEDPDIPDEDYDNYELNDDDDDDLDDLATNSKITFIDNELENESKIQFIIKSDDKITSNILTIYEMTELIGIRATQISQGAPVFVDIEYISDPIEMAKKEIINNKCPLYIKRYIGLDRYELWDPNIMIKPKI